MRGRTAGAERPQGERRIVPPFFARGGDVAARKKVTAVTVAPAGPAVSAGTPAGGVRRNRREVRVYFRKEKNFAEKTDLLLTCYHLYVVSYVLNKRSLTYG